MKYVIIGSRDFTDYEFVKSALECHLYDITHIISGGARGADKLAIKYAKEHNIPYTEYMADWENQGRAAGAIRNQTMVTLADKVIAFWDGKSKGTEHSIRIARRQGKEVVVYFIPNCEITL